jgi:hypothetical protein
VIGNGSHGLQIVGNDNRVTGTDAGDLGRGNDGDGINVAGHGNEVRRNRVFANAGDGIEVTGGWAAAPNVVVENVVGDRGKGNRGNGIFVFSAAGAGGAGPAEIDKNTVRGNLDDGIHLAVSATGHGLRSNVIGGASSQDNGNCEFNVAPGNVNLGGNKVEREERRRRLRDSVPGGVPGHALAASGAGGSALDPVGAAVTRRSTAHGGGAGLGDLLVLL